VCVRVKENRRGLHSRTLSFRFHSLSFFASAFPEGVLASFRSLCAAYDRNVSSPVSDESNRSWFEKSFSLATSCTKISALRPRRPTISYSRSFPSFFSTILYSRHHTLSSKICVPTFFSSWSRRCRLALSAGRETVSSAETPSRLQPKTPRRCPTSRRHCLRRRFRHPNPSPRV
jgi:hypothetical protein